MSRHMTPPSPTPAGPSLDGGHPVSSIAAALRGGGSTGHSGPVLPPRSPRQSLGVGDGATVSVSRRAETTAPGGAGLPVAGSPIPFDLLMRGWR